MNENLLNEAREVAAALATELFLISRMTSIDNKTEVPTFTLKHLARKAHSIARLLK